VIVKILVVVSTEEFTEEISSIFVFNAASVVASSDTKT
jgi:hypothetical protein